MSIWDPGHQVELSGVKVQQKELKDQCGVVQLLQFIGNQETSRNMEISDSESDSPKGLQNRSRTKQLSMRLLPGCGIDLSSDFPGDFNLFWHSLTYDGFVGLKPCVSLGVSNIECRVGAVHICAYCEATAGVEFQGVHASAERAHARPATSDCFFPELKSRNCCERFNTRAVMIG